MALVTCFFCKSKVSSKAFFCNECNKDFGYTVFADKVIGNPIKIGNLEIAQHDFPFILDWSLAMDIVFELGVSWRLPTKRELNILYKNKKDIPGFEDFYYWSSTKVEYENLVWQQGIIDGKVRVAAKNYMHKFRPVRNYEKPFIKEKIIGNPIQIDKLEITEKDFPNNLTINEANMECKKLGDGWRLPTGKEIALLFKHKKQIGKFASAYLTCDFKNSNFSTVVQEFDDFGFQFTGDRHYPYPVRFVRTIKKNTK
jgi:hypothetical protein